MSIIHSARTMMTPIHREGYPFIALFFALSVLLGFVWLPLFWAGLVVTIWSAYFFRDPQRFVPQMDDAVISPADGKISFVGLTVPDESLGLPQEEMLRISVFMDIFSCHVNRMPMRGAIKEITYRKGRLFNAQLDKASEANEANSVLLETDHGAIGVVQIAGLVARRIVCWAKKEEEIGAGERFGLIRFGSRLDVYLPKDARPCVGVGQTMIAGESVLAEFITDAEDNDADGGAIYFAPDIARERAGGYSHAGGHFLPEPAAESSLAESLALEMHFTPEAAKEVHIKELRARADARLPEPHMRFRLD